MPSPTVREIIRNISQRNLQSTPSVKGFFDQRNRQTIDAAKTALAARAAVSGLSVAELQQREGENAQREIDAARQKQTNETARLEFERERVASGAITANAAAVRAANSGSRTISGAGAEALGLPPSAAGNLSPATARESSRVIRAREAAKREDERIASLAERRKQVSKKEQQRSDLEERKEARLRSKTERARIQENKDLSQEQKDEAADESFEEALASIRGNTASQEDMNAAAQESIEELGLPPEFFTEDPNDKNRNKADRERLKKLMIEKLEAKGFFVPKSQR